MFKIIQSHRTENLVEELLTEYQSEQQAIFDPFVVIVPSMVLGDWLDKVIASRAGISTLVLTKFWGQYQWTLMQDVLSRHNAYLLSKDPNAKTVNVPEVAVLSPTVMQWRLFGYLTFYADTIIKDQKHPLNPILSSLVEEEADEEDLDGAQVKDNINTNNKDKNNKNKNNSAQRDARLWQLASDLARVFNRYLTHREDWLLKWSTNKALDVEQMIAEKDTLSLRFDKYSRGTPHWLVDHYIELEAAQRYLWSNLFADVHLYRVALEKQFWKALKLNQANERDQLPKVLRIFTIQQLPQTELDFLQQLSQYMDITLLHYNPSKLFWADIVDKSWLQRQQIINPESVFLRDYGHSLLSRLGKQSRDTFAMLANLSGNEDYQDVQVIWQDNFKNEINPVYAEDFVKGHAEVYDKTKTETIIESSQSSSNQPSSQSSSQSMSQPTSRSLSLLQKLQNDVLMLDEQATQQATAAKVSKDIGEQIEPSFEPSLEASIEASIETSEESNVDYYADEALENKRYEKERSWDISPYDNSLSIHSCHSLQRQLEVLRIMIGRWLNEPISAGQKKRHISDIVVLLPDVERHHALISSIFVSGKGQDGLTLPAKVTGVVDSEIRQLWEAVTGFYKLLGSDSARFEASEVLDWLMLPPLFENFGLTHEQMSRGCDLLVEAGFIRGFDERHLQQTLDDKDFDYRFSFAQALDRLTLGLVMPEAAITDCLYPLKSDQWPSTTIPEMSLPLPEVSLNDAPIIEALCLIFTGLDERRDDYKQKYKAETWLDQIETQVIHRYFGAVDQTRSMRAIYNAMNGFKSSLRANRHYQQYSTNAGKTLNEVESRLATVERLPLKLSFMLDSIEDELESQQVSAEPTGVITFGRFGALRNVPFDLVVMLNMNLSEFPNRDRDNRYDLMKSTIARRGDRVSEDDDNGAFLDALLCARSACWLFYNGQSLTDTHEHLPANPVSELLQFLQGEVQWQVNSLEAIPNDINSETENLQRYLPNLIKQWLVTEHPALPFHSSLFEIESNTPLTSHKVDSNGLQTDQPVKPDRPDELDQILDNAMSKTKLQQKKQFPPAPLWQAVFNTLKTRVSDEKVTDKQTQLVEMPTQGQYQLIAQVFGNGLGQLGKVNSEMLMALAEMLHLVDQKQTGIEEESAESLLANTLFDIEEIDVDAGLIYQVRHPAKAFLRNQKIHVVQGEEAMDLQEPLFLDHLSKYQITEHLLHNLSSSADYEGIESFKSNASETNFSHDTSGLHNQALLYQKIMPAGVARQTTLPNQVQKLKLLCNEFKAQLAANQIDIEIDAIDSNANADDSAVGSENLFRLLSPTAEHPVRIETDSIIRHMAGKTEIYNTDTIENINDLPKQSTSSKQTDSSDNDNALQWLKLLPRAIKIKSSIPLMRANGQVQYNTNLPYSEQSPKQWLNILPNSASPKHLLKFWLSHLYWQIARHTTAQQVALHDGVSIWRFNKSSSQVDTYKNFTTFKLPPITYEQAVIELLKWAVYGNLVGLIPITLLPDYALQYLNKCQQVEEKEQGNYWPKRSDFSAWLAPNYGTDTVYDTCSQHAIWRYILRDQDTFKALTGSLTTLSKALYEPMFTMLQGLEG